jgi:hypothetical protein
VWGKEDSKIPRKKDKKEKKKRKKKNSSQGIHGFGEEKQKPTNQGTQEPRKSEIT